MGYRRLQLAEATVLDIVLDSIAAGRIPLQSDADLVALLDWLTAWQARGEIPSPSYRLIDPHPGARI